MIKCVLFDLDGTLIDSEPYSIESKIIEGKKRGIDFDEEFIIKGFGLSRENSRLYYKEKYGDVISYDELAKYRLEYILRAMKNGTFKCKPFAKEIVEYLKENNIKIGLCTSTTTKNISLYQDYIPFLKDFDAYVTNDDVTYGKPNPETFLIGMRKLNALSQETLIIEDSLAGLEAGVLSNAEVIMVPDYIKPNDYVTKNSIKVMKDLNEVKEYIKKVNNQ